MQRPISSFCSAAIDSATSLGIPSEAEFIARYCKLAGLDEIEDWTFYLAYNMFRSAAIVQGVYRRGLDGNASSERAVSFAGYCRARADIGWALIGAT